MSEIVISLKNCFKIYREPISRLETVALQDVDFDINLGEILSIIGPSGSGKSTLLNLIGGLDLPSAGKVIHQFNGEKINLPSLSSEERDYYRTINVGYLQQKPILMPNYTALENVELPLLAKGILKPRQKAEYWLNKLGLSQRKNSKPNQLSGGERQRVSLASALSFNPRILLADEPTAEVDSKTTEEIMDLLIKLNEELNLTVILVTHDPKIANRSHRSFRLEDGKIISRENLSKQNEYLIELDQFNRLKLPVEIMDHLHNPTIILVQEINKNKFNLTNGEMQSDGQIENLVVVDKKGRFRLSNISGTGKIVIVNNNVIISMEEKNE